MKQNKITLFITNTVLYTCIVIGLYLLYSPLNKHLNNSVGSNTQFVYQQF
jgi:hypothetical protein